MPQVGWIVVPLAVVWSINNAMAADVGSGGGASSAPSSSSSSSSSSSTNSAGGNGFYEDTRPVVTGGSSYDSQAYAPSGAGTDNPFGFSSGFSPGGCAPSLAFADTARGSNATVLERPSGPRRGSARYVQMSVGGSETFSDNINLDPGDQAESDFVTAVAPRFDACSSTGRIRGEGTYQLQGVVYANNSHYNDVYNDAQGQTSIDLIENHLYLNANTEFGQRVIDPSVGYSRSNIIRPNDNKTREWLTNISPYVVQSLGLVGQAIVRYRYGRSVYLDRNVPDTTVNGVSATVNSPDIVEPISWQAQVVSQIAKRSGGNNNDWEFFKRYREIFGDDAVPDYATRNDTQHFDSATLQLGYRVSRTIKLTALGGVEDRYKSNGENDRWSSTRWQVGAHWNSAENSVVANYGHRFYGASYSLSVLHRAELFDLSLSYEETPSSPGLDSLDSVGSGYTYGSIGSMFGGTGYDSNGELGTTSLFDRGVYIRKRWQARIGFDTALTHTDVTGYSQRREYQSDSAPDSSYHGAEIDTRYDFGPRTSIVPSVRWEHQDQSFVATVNSDGSRLRANSTSDNYDAGVSVVRVISPSAQAAVGYARSWRNDSNGFDYHENRVTLQFRKAF